MSESMAGTDPFVEAERWFARRLTGDPAPIERSEFERWHARPANARAYAETERLWRDAAGLAGDAELERMAAEALSATAQAKPWTRYALAASVAVLVTSAAVVAVLRLYNPAVEYSTARGERNTVTLADGSKLFLNTDSAVNVRMNDAARELVLMRGEALFEVAQDVRRPFRVRAGSGEVTVLGTRFQMRKKAEEITVTLLDGKVQVLVDRDFPAEQLQLVPGDQIAFAGERGAVAKRRVDPDIVSSWSRGRLLFRDTPLKDVVEEVNRYASTKLRIRDFSLTDLPVSGTFPIGDSESMALALQALLPIQAVPSGRGEISLSRR